FGKICRTGFGQAGIERMVGAPPDLGAQAVSQVAERLDGAGEQQGLTQRYGLWLEALLLGLCKKGLGVGWNDYAGDNLDIIAFECRDLGAEVLRAVLKAARVGQLIALCSQWLGESEFFVAPGIAVAVVWKEPAYAFVGIKGIPAVDKVCDDIFKAPEHVVCPVEAFGRIAFAAKEPGLPGNDTREAGYFIEFTGVADRVGCFGRTCCQHQGDLIIKHQVVGYLARTVGVRLAVL